MENDFYTKREIDEMLSTEKNKLIKKIDEQIKWLPEGENPEAPTMNEKSFVLSVISSEN